MKPEALQNSIGIDQRWENQSSIISTYRDWKTIFCCAHRFYPSILFKKKSRFYKCRKHLRAKAPPSRKIRYELHRKDEHNGYTPSWYKITFSEMQCDIRWKSGDKNSLIHKLKELKYLHFWERKTIDLAISKFLLSLWNKLAARNVEISMIKKMF